MENLADQFEETGPGKIPTTVGMFASFDGTDIVYETYAPESASDRLPAIVCCNGIACVAHAYWDPLVEGLSDKTTVVLWDYRGHGVSSAPKNPSEITVPSFARDLLCLMEEVGLRSAVLVGHSFGVQVALEAVRLDRAAVDGLVAVAGPHRRPLGDLYGLPIARVAVSVLEPLAEVASGPTRTIWKAAFQTPLPYLIGKVSRMAGPRATADAMRTYFEGLGAADPVLLLRMFKAMDYQDATEMLPDLDIPVLLIAGRNDVMTPLYVMEEMHELIPNSRLEIIENAGHTLPIEAGAQLVSLVEEFIENLPEREN